jgi:hypothetical protein
MLSVVMLGVVMLSVVMLIILAPVAWLHHLRPVLQHFLRW